MPSIVGNMLVCHPQSDDNINLNLYVMNLLGTARLALLKEAR